MLPADSSAIRYPDAAGWPCARANATSASSIAVIDPVMKKPSGSSRRSAATRQAPSQCRRPGEEVRHVPHSGAAARAAQPTALIAAVSPSAHRAEPATAITATSAGPTT